MIDTNRLLELLDLWALWMRSDNHKLGFPSKSIGMYSGGESTVDSFAEMVEAQDMANIRTLDAIVHSLPKEQQEAIYARYLDAKKPLAYPYKLELALDNMLTISSRRINA
jgi:hypothetical protein